MHSAKQQIDSKIGKEYGQECKYSEGVKKAGAAE